MTKYARVIGGIVQEVFIPPGNVPMKDCFTPEVVAMFTECPEEVEAGWHYRPELDLDAWQPH